MTTVPSLLAGVLVVLLVIAVTGLLGMVSLSDVLRRLVPQPQPSPPSNADRKEEPWTVIG